ncbi:MAG: GIY-YIG nuclease family protein [Pseudomonadota bacterium]
MRLNTLLREAGLAPEACAVMLHTPQKPKLRRMLPWLAAERPDVFATYQSVHVRNVEPTLKARRNVVVFLDIGAGRQVLAGLYAVEGWEERPLEALDADPAFIALSRDWGDLRVTEYARERGEATRCVFDMRRCDALAAYRGRLVIAKPKGRGYVRLAENLDAEVLALAEHSLLVAPPPEWRDFVVTGAEVRRLPRDWAARLAEWRGVYLIVDEVDGARYVGSAYGAENLAGRWAAHVAGARGVTKHLAARDPAGFRFSILERVSPDMEVEDVVALENSWKLRLHTIDFGLNHA